MCPGHMNIVRGPLGQRDMGVTRMLDYCIHALEGMLPETILDICADQGL